MKTTKNAFQQSMFKPDSDWQLPESLPRLADAKAIGLDIETKDPELKTKGPGVRRDNSYILGISIAVPEGDSWYLPFGHLTGKQFSKNVILRWAREELCRPNQPKVGANLLYDLDWLYGYDVPVTGPFYDVQIAEPLLNENRPSYSLDALSKDYLGVSKNERLIKEATLQWKGSAQGHLWRLPPELVGPYAETDALQPIQIFRKQWELLRKDDLVDLFQMETDLIPMLLEMRQRGVRIDVPKLEQVIDQKEKELAKIKKELKNVDPWSNHSIARLFDKEGLSYERTAANNPSFQQSWLERHPAPIAKKIVAFRKTDKFIGTFLKGSLRDMLIDDRIHCQFNQLKSDDGGTVTGRFSSSNPNLQFIPNRDEELGPLVRSLFIPDTKDEEWARADYSQIEIRILVHYATGPGSIDIVEAYKENPQLDYHTWCAEKAGVNRTRAKTINFGLIYGMGAGNLSKQLNVTLDEGKEFLDMYYAQLPFLRKTIVTAAATANRRGYVRTTLGRRRRFNLWEAQDRSLPIKPNADKALIARQAKEYGSFAVRAGTYKAFNAIDQGTAADIMKKAMVDIYKSGICSVLGPPLLTVHDELDWTKPRTKEANEAFEESVRLMEDTISLKIPVIVDSDTGKNWGDVK